MTYSGEPPLALSPAYFLISKRLSIKKNPLAIPLSRSAWIGDFTLFVHSVNYSAICPVTSAGSCILRPATPAELFYISLAPVLLIAFCLFLLLCTLHSLSSSTCLWNIQRAYSPPTLCSSGAQCIQVGWEQKNKTKKKPVVRTWALLRGSKLASPELWGFWGRPVFTGRKGWSLSDALHQTVIRFTVERCCETRRRRTALSQALWIFKQPYVARACVIHRQNKRRALNIRAQKHLKGHRSVINVTIFISKDYLEETSPFMPQI